MNLRVSRQCSLCQRFRVREGRKTTLVLAAGKGFGKVQEKEALKVRAARFID
jgi:hypothetical protein